MGVDPQSLLRYAFIGAPYALAFALGILVPVAGLLCYSSYGAGIVAIVGMYAVEALYMVVGAIKLGVLLYYTDLALGFVFLVVLLRFVLERDRPSLHTPWLVCCGVMALSLSTGLLAYGSTAGVQARAYFYFAAAALYGMSFRIDDRRIRQLLNSLVVMAGLLLCITAYRWTVYYLPLTSLLPEEGAYNVDGAIRVIRSYEALVLGQVLVLCIFFTRASSLLPLARALSPLLLAVVIVLQHRSVWTAALAGVGASLLIGRLQRSAVTGRALLLTVVVVVTVLPLFASDHLSGVSAQIGSSTRSALNTSGSAGERLDSWRQIIDNWAAAGPRSIVIGQSFGTDPTRYVHDEAGGLRRIDYTAHNMYVQTLFNTGLLGLGGYLVAAAYVLRGLWRICLHGGGAPVQALLVLVTMQLVYYVPYGTDYLQSLIFGIALAHVAGHETSQRSVAGKRNAKLRRPPPWRWA